MATKKNKKFLKGYYADLKPLKDCKNQSFFLVGNRLHYSEIKCPRCNGKFLFKKNNNYKYGYFYECRSCKYQLDFIEFQKRYINYNWQKTIENGFKLYSWDQKCPVCSHINPCISYCINESVGTEEMCLFKPILLGSVLELDRFIMWFCSSVNLFPDETGKLVPTTFCSKCDAPYSPNFFMDSFMNQSKFDIEYNIKKDILKSSLNLQIDEIVNLLKDLKLLDS